MGYSGQLFRYAKGPISEDDFPRPGEDVTVGDGEGEEADREQRKTKKSRKPKLPGIFWR